MTIDEDDFVRTWLRRCRRDPALVVEAGDDAAALVWSADQLLVLAVDQVCEGVHFTPATAPERAGRKLLARNLSDLAAMGAQPTHALLCLAIPPERDRAWADGFMRGLLELADAVGVALVGGDTGAAPAFVASLTLLGRATRVCRRDGARPGDRIVVTGAFGGAVTSGRHLDFTPRLAEGRWLTAEAHTHAMIDVSDGLLKDLGRLAAASSLEARVDPTAIPLNPGADLTAAWTEGEDYELLAAVAPTTDLTAWPSTVPLTCIGTFAAGPAGVVTTAGDPVQGVAWDHFSKEETQP